jgi:hypothetical protein
MPAEAQSKSDTDFEMFSAKSAIADLDAVAPTKSSLPDFALLMIKSATADLMGRFAATSG